MGSISIKDLDYREILINNYRELGISELQLVIILLIDSISKESPVLVTGNVLTHKMNIDSTEIEEEIVDLMNKSLLTYKTVNGLMVTSLDPMYEKIIKFIFENNKKTNEIEESDDFAKTLSLLEEVMKRPLTPLEIEVVQSWFKDEVSFNQINKAIDEASLKGTVTVKKVDKLLLKQLAQNDISSEGFTSVDEKTRRDIKKTMDIMNYNWVDNDK